ncbi:MAG: hypothetical protein KAS39_00360, partial [Actinomycetia bacterium]|nr:hypothetical protein [Actinomycetes bacterium]
KTGSIVIPDIIFNENDMIKPVMMPLKISDKKKDSSLSENINAALSDRDSFHGVLVTVSTVADKERKIELNRMMRESTINTEAQNKILIQRKTIVDMEGSYLAEYFCGSGKDLLFIKAVSDSIDAALPSERTLRTFFKKRYFDLIKIFLITPIELIRSVKILINSKRAMSALVSFLNRNYETISTSSIL